MADDAVNPVTVIKRFSQWCAVTHGHGLNECNQGELVRYSDVVRLAEGYEARQQRLEMEAVCHEQSVTELTAARAELAAAQSHSKLCGGHQEEYKDKVIHDCLVCSLEAAQERLWCIEEEHAKCQKGSKD